MEAKWLKALFPRCAEQVGDDWDTLIAGFGDNALPEALPEFLEAATISLPAYLPDLARLELALHGLQAITPPASAEEGASLQINPSLTLLPLKWKHLCSMLWQRETQVGPESGEEFVLLYKTSVRGKVRVRPAADRDLLALKMMAENLDRQAVADETGVPVGAVDAAIEAACDQGLLLSAPSAIVRTAAHYPADGPDGWQRHLRSAYFTLQWHVTQACDLHCKHCYDRSAISPLTLDQGKIILDQFREFVLDQRVHGQVTFTGGNPLLYAHFAELYREAAHRNFTLAILGNPTSRQVLESLQQIQPLSFYQVSLEGLPEHNDSIRGPGHFQRIMEFLEILKELSIYSMVMLTLTRENMGQVLELAEILRGKVDLFTFNRLSQTGEGADLAAADKKKYRAFLEDYLEAAKSNPTISLKDNLINILKAEERTTPFGGCTGFGCGAAFNFCSLLPNGDMHACRKFQSPIGNVLESSLLELYHSPAAERYRLGPEECRGCKIRPVCGGCQAVIQSSGLDITISRDPYCFLEGVDKTS
ncbi:MAG: selenobiotic family peptide radical SAM maturase [Proteobacteria bacterium]|nr:selenobiotic family peptide radical SAM maturase [Pseudomonadota bacterium]MBU1418780.1 selenobiotic family peptide radical SAM maturase [Pseudomonadota bacterium]MBU1455456.1 selenobiotic family peptide radical SAM maturase [Pseudomonadota bacterium]